MEVCWNGSTDAPKFFYTNGKPAKNNARMIAPSLAPYDAKLATFLYTGKLQDERVAKADNAWQGGVLAEGWLRMKYLVLPRAKGGKRIHLDSRDKFLKSEEIGSSSNRWHSTLWPRVTRPRSCRRR